jgi:hypothetical protein
MATAKHEQPAEDLNDLNQRIADEATKAQTDEATKPTTAPPPKPTSKD